MITRTRYSPKEIEKKWQTQWEAENLYHAPDDSPKPKFYNLVMLPYPSGDLHIGHWYNYSGADAYGRYMRMNGYNVMQPIGFDAFGLPAENAAISRGVQARTWTLSNIDNMRLNCAGWARNGTGSAKSSPASLTTTNGRSGCSCNSTSTTWPIAPKRPPTGVQAATPRWRTNRCWQMAPASAAVQLSSAKRSTSGCSASPNMLKNCWTSRKSNGPKRP